jgi:uncharacterized membrane protein YtjA (UPF0391 family)
MYGWAVTLAIIAMIFAILGFTGISGTVTNVALAVFVIAAIGTVVFVVLGWNKARTNV